MTEIILELTMWQIIFFLIFENHNELVFFFFLNQFATKPKSADAYPYQIMQSVAKTDNKK